MTQEQLKELAVGSVIESEKLWRDSHTNERLPERWQKVVAGPTEDVWQCIRPNNGIQITDGSRLLSFRKCRILEGVELLAMLSEDDAPDRWTSSDMARNLEELHLLLVLSRKDPVHQAEHVMKLVHDSTAEQKLVHFLVGLFVGSVSGAVIVSLLIRLFYGIW